MERNRGFQRIRWWARDEDFQCSLDARKEISPEKRGHVSPALRTESQHIGDGDVKRREMPNLTLQLSLERTVENKNVDNVGGEVFQRETPSV